MVIDLFSRKVVGWAMAPNMPADLFCAALNMSVRFRKPSQGLIVHSDRGSVSMQAVNIRRYLPNRVLFVA